MESGRLARFRAAPVKRNRTRPCGTQKTGLFAIPEDV
jgi:hypothetical protein